LAAFCCGMALLGRGGWGNTVVAVNVVGCAAGDTVAGLWDEMDCRALEGME